MGPATPFSCFNLVIRSRGEEQEGIKGKVVVGEWQERTLGGQHGWLRCGSAACLPLTGANNAFSDF